MTDDFPGKVHTVPDGRNVRDYADEIGARRFPWPNRRHLRADAAIAHILRIIEPYIDKSARAIERNVYRACERDLHLVFQTSGVEMVTDMDRAAAGLPPRDRSGYTHEELQILEAYHRDAMLRPLTLGPLHVMPSTVVAANKIEPVAQLFELKPHPGYRWVVRSDGVVRHEKDPG